MAGINDLIDRLQRMSSGKVYEAIGRKMADVCHEQAIIGFREQIEPTHGTPWARRKDPRGGWPILQKTNAGVNSLTARYAGGTIRLRIKGYFQFHQFGTKKMVARRVFPTQERGLGLWRAPLNEAATNAVREIINGRST